MAYAANKRSDDIIYPGLIAAWSAKGKTNEDSDRNVLKDLTGNGHDITLNNFAYSGMSGYGGYSTEFDLKKWTIASGSSLSIKYTKTKAILKPSSLDKFTSNNFRYTSFKSLSLRFKTNINCEITEAININDNLELTRTPVIANKETLFIAEDISNIEGLTQRWIYWAAKKESLPQEGFIIELIPEHPDALVFDGVDDYGISKGMPILTDYTIIAKRNFFYETSNYESALISKSSSVGNGAFIFDRYIKGNTHLDTFNFGELNSKLFPIKDLGEISWQTSTSYNQKRIQKGIGKDEGLIALGAMRDNDKILFKGAFYSAYLFNRSLDDQEIKSFIRKHIDSEYLLPNEILTPDVYYDFTNGDNSKGEANNVITDLSGNGNDATAHNFAWNEESGYADGGLKFDGVDDYINLDTFDSGFKTMFMVCTNYKKDVMLYDQRSEPFNKNYSVAHYPRTIAYNNNNINGTYINGTLNTKLTCQELTNKKHLIHVVAKDISESRKPNIGRSLGKNQHSNMILYKFLGFKEALTEEQIKAVINKYNLLDGVDNIDVN